MADAYAVVVGIQEYQQSGLSGVNYAHADAHEMAAVLADRFDVPKTNIKVWLDHDATAAQCDAVGGNLLQQTQNLVHVWAVPGYESPEGVFSHLSSAITCADGTYSTIADVTKIGSATTICKDGTE